ncbi:hypothetical protein Kisp01_01840 [Kineosporia sp. NBRC 101677]|nr:hypothetical protein Kisp01_01840 [Kineosporia sp. NBRC 101677]
MLATQQHGRLRSQTTENDVVRVDDMPATVDVTGLGGKRTHWSQPRSDQSIRVDIYMCHGQQPDPECLGRGLLLRAPTCHVPERLDMAYGSHNDEPDYRPASGGSKRGVGELTINPPSGQADEAREH